MKLNDFRGHLIDISAKQLRYYVPCKLAPDADDTTTTKMATLKAIENSDPVQLHGRDSVFRIKYEHFWML